MSDLPDSLKQNPALADWIEFDNQAKSVTIRTGKVELGQGISTALVLIAADELDLLPAQIRVTTGNTLTGPNEFMTAGSMSIESSGSAIRQVSAEVRLHLLSLASAKLGADSRDLIVEEGLIRHPLSNESVSYWDLDNDLTHLMATGAAKPKPSSAYKHVGGTMTRIDLAAKVTGQRAFIQDAGNGFDSLDLLYGCVVRPQWMAFELESLNPKSIEQMPGVIKVVIDGSFVGVVATSQYAVTVAWQRLQEITQWRNVATDALPADIPKFLRSHVQTSLLVKDGIPVADPIPPAMDSPDIEASYFKPYILHGSIAPSAASAIYTPDSTVKLHIASHSQGPHVIRAAIAQALDMDPESIVVEHQENAGCYGHNGADDAAMDAALLALSVPNRKILLQWQRQDEHLWEPCSPAMQIDLAARVSQGRITSWQASVYSQTHMSRPIPFGSVSNLLAAWQRSKPKPRAQSRAGLAPHGGIHRNSDPYYNFEVKRITKNLVTDQRVRTSSTRGLGAFANVFAIETFLDEIAGHLGVDANQLRLRHLEDPRAIEIIKTMQVKSDKYQSNVETPWVSGRGFAFARYKNTKCYAGVEIHLMVNENTFEIKLLHADIIADAGLVIDRDGLANQLEGGMIQAASWTLKEAVRFDEFNRTSTDWESYPILTFKEIPTVDVTLINHPDEPSLGAGEATMGPTPAAISNAVFDAVGLRLREMPFDADTLRRVSLQA